MCLFALFFVYQQSAYEMRIIYLSSCVCSSDLIARDARGARRRAHDQVGIADRLDLKAEPREGEGVAGGQRAREIFLDPAQSPPVSEAYVGHRCLHDDSGIAPVLRRELRVRNAPAAKLRRASCRERVCPYLLLLVVAGTLKKQKLNK